MLVVDWITWGDIQCHSRSWCWERWCAATARTGWLASRPAKLMWTGWLVSSPGGWHVFGLVFLHHHIGQEDNDKGGKKKWNCKGPAFEILGRDRGRSPKNPRWMVDRSEFGGSFSYQTAPFWCLPTFESCHGLNVGANMMTLPGGVACGRVSTEQHGIWCLHMLEQT